MKIIKILILIFILTLSLASCGPAQGNEESGYDSPAQGNEEPQPPKAPPTYYHIEGVDVETVITYFNEVCLNAEYSDGGNPSLLQKWDIPIKYHLSGQYTNKDLEVLKNFVDWLNTVEGFPGMYSVDTADEANLKIHFGTRQEIIDILGSNFADVDGGVTFWYTDNAIYEANICYLTTIEQNTRNSVIIEEIYNSLGPAQDTSLRPDSIIYSEFSTPQELTQIDELILQLLYHPEMKCGMDMEQCDAVIRGLYN